MTAPYDDEKHHVDVTVQLAATADDIAAAEEKMNEMPLDKCMQVSAGGWRP